MAKEWRWEPGTTTGELLFTWLLRRDILTVSSSSSSHVECLLWYKTGKIIFTELISPCNHLVSRWGFTPLVEAHRFHHRHLVEYLMKHIQMDYSDQLENCQRLLQKMEEKCKDRKLSLKKT